MVDDATSPDRSGQVDMNSEPTTYETPDSPALDYTESPPPPEYQSEHIAIESVNSNSAREKFNASQVDGTSTDFRTIKTKGWHLSTRPESGVERIARLRREIEELATDLSDAEHASLSQGLEAACMTPNLATDSEATGKVASKTNLESIERLSLLESRISSIENRFNSTTEYNLAAQIDLLRLKVNAITENEVMEDIITRLKKMNDESATVAKSAVMSRLEELYEASGSIKGLAKSTPILVERLRSLQGIHESAAESKMRLDTVKAALNERRAEVANWSQALESMEEQMKLGMTTLHQNADVLASLVDPLLSRLNE
ncbi:Putative uncharacterized protein [Taphrina deformans PYCC 5710]|uniref:Dynactin subunit 2 n=1 Tax=Taphrina deformans (strain PYCC 5710 / ATCC 11124 / CBS 356.35 / IMI 108563 / JCM 9778 / NBRC 8474) TaxID=1097556 RepID=R4XCH0_TAPDE|nr:Putative uncharacterized protein [Taphrina deformans PYCC 5710]|eukprot:CCG81015.1 Putative uncharacterized protein [Taphrina deformans PYCC 5710]